MHHWGDGAAAGCESGAVATRFSPVVTLLGIGRDHRLTDQTKNPGRRSGVQPLEGEKQIARKRGEGNSA